MPATPSQIQAGLKARLITISGLRAVDYIPDNFNPPIAIPALEQIRYHRAFGGGDAVHEYAITVIVASASERTAQARLDGYLAFDGPNSIRAAIEGDPTLGGVVDTCVVGDAAGIGNLDIAGTKYLVVTFSVTVHP